ncbi:DEAD/DEAH box helicase [Pseudomonas fluorescens]|uniref:Ligase-associated DNA damage response endonuclease PdeM n=1 Tax=Pseudomonas lactucae TaxID=2813360 RepID=A0A9X0YAT2_9PSED|nr:ligase-associated DNA damage response endonuclease PdeM [Pseudomonas lactucae]OPA96235.1 DEAD/DEAH box helicase [Pseudomonas fluorescens]MBN2976708.1 ligase-associated DNA damage response endonuclease PdeM [Pseudomonas lactucae]MBN2989635.1 ligase-associated DNA damage response endonuclease PdeM [Pseudomonas lactucae]OPB12614.1 DEAD/DEAH box helicase [Pseudomonas fluorescens]OPB26361.1 DEAD/DEAH box helicase [Pseudomonas fluorescens]
MHCSVTLEGEELWLLADKAVYWPARRCLLIADAHFGKAAAYRSLGQPVPQGTTTENVKRLDRLLAAYRCERVIFLGDFLHGPGSHASGTLAVLRAWRERNPELPMTLIRGNHDKRAGDPPADLRIEVVQEPLLMGPFALQHEPDAHASHHVLAGHVHPVYRLRGKGRQSLRLPCFQVGGRVSLLPAYGAFTGGFTVTQDNDRQIYVIGDHQVWPVHLSAD